MGKIPYLSPEQVWTRIMHYCNYRERCHFEVKQRLFAMGSTKKEVDLLVVRLIEENLLNEERYAKEFARGHFRQKNWGKLKIIRALRLKKVSEPLIRIALRQLELGDYTASLQKLAAVKWASLKHEQYINRQAKTGAYLLRKGFEPAAVHQAIREIRQGQKDK